MRLGLRSVVSVRGILIAIGLVGTAYLLVITLQLQVVIGPGATRLHGRTSDLLSDHDSIAAHVGALRARLASIARLVPDEPGGALTSRAPEVAALTIDIRVLLDRSTSMRSSLDIVDVPPRMRVLLADAAETETSAALTLLDALRTIELGRSDEVYPFVRAAGVLLDSTTASLAAAQRVAFVTVLDDEDRLRTDVDGLRLWTLGWSAGGVLLLIAMAWVVRQRLYGPIDAMERAVQRIAGGDLSANVPVIRADELGRLASHVNEMTAVLRDKATAEAQRAESLAERFGRILDESASGIYLFDAETLQIRQANRDACERLGYSPEELVRLTMLDVLDVAHRHLFDSELDLLRQGEQSRLVLPTRLTRWDGSTYPVEMSVRLSRSGGESVFVAVVEDATARHRARELNDRLRDFALAEQRSLVAGDLTLASRAINEMVSDALGTESCGIWRPEQGRLTCLDRFEGLRRSHGVAAPLLQEDDPGFFERLGAARILATASSLDVPVRLAGRLVAVLRLTRLAGAGPWTAEEEVFASSVADLTSHAVAAAESNSLERQLARAQKMDSIGQLAGGVAHDFNNVLTAILGNLEVGRAGLTPADPLDSVLAEAEHAARHAAALTRRLLTFARHQVVEERIVDLNELSRGADRMIRRLIGASIEMTSEFDPELRPVLLDPGQFEQVIVNLAVNARDAMPNGGRLVIETRNVTIDEAYVATHAESRPGEYVELSVSDTGIGMDRATQDRIFEPFFTTKGAGKGTGLGLAVSYGIVRQAGGHIWVYSEPGRGTVFKIHLPAAEGTPEPGSAPAPRVDATEGRGDETILLVEDERSIRELLRKILSGKGYHVIVAEDGETALEAAANHPGVIDLVLTDVVLPKLGGPQVVERLRAQRRGLRVIYMSGYTAEATSGFEMTGSGTSFLSKPFTPSQLGRRIREALAETQEGKG
jgi:two-component system cell cycle sensor histidine kinase/response regulator CckA